MQRLRESIHIRTMKAKRKVEEISKEDVQAFFKKNAFVLFTVGAVIVGMYASASSQTSFSQSLVNAMETHIHTYNAYTCLCRYYSGLHAPAVQDDLSRSEVLLFPWRATNENASDACSPFTSLQSNHRYNPFTHHAIHVTDLSMDLGHVNIHFACVRVMIQFLFSGLLRTMWSLTFPQLHLCCCLNESEIEWWRQKAWWSEGWSQKT